MLSRSLRQIDRVLRRSSILGVVIHCSARYGIDCTHSTLEGIPQECFEHRLGNRSALEWVIDQYQVSTDKCSGIESDPNHLDNPQYIMRLVKQVVTVSVKTVELVKELAEVVSVEDWLGEQDEESVEVPA